MLLLAMGTNKRARQSLGGTMYATADSMGCATPYFNLRCDARDYRANVRLLLMVNAGHAVPGDTYWFRSGDRRALAAQVTA